MNLVALYPSAIQDGDLLFLQFGHINSTSQAAAVYSLSAGWTTIAVEDRVNNCRRWLYYRVGTSNLSSTTYTVGVSGGIPTGQQSVDILQFRGVNTDNPYEGLTNVAGNSVTISDAPVVSTGQNELACNFLFVGPSNDINEFTGEVGGDWTVAYATEAAEAARQAVQVATLTSSGTIDGGLLTLVTSGAWLNRGLALLPSATAMVLTPSGIAETPAFGATPPIVTPMLFAGTYQPIVNPINVSASGFATSIAAGTPSVQVTSGLNISASGFAALLSGGTPFVTSGAVLWVSTTGDDSDPGTFNQPFLTIQQACDVVNAGHTVMVLPGTYSGNILLTRSGTSTNRIHFKSSTRWGAKIVLPTDSTNSEIWRIRANYIDVEGFEITADGSPVVRCGIVLDGDNLGQYSRIYRNHIHTIGAYGETGMGGAAIVDAAGEYLGHGGEIFENWIHDMGYIIEGHSPRVHGIYTASPDCDVYNNIVYKCQSFGLQANHNPLRNLFRNNLSFANGDGSLWHNDSAITLSCVYVNNILLGSIGGNGLGDSFITNYNSLTANVQFVNYQADGSGDYRLQSGSPCRDSGTNAYMPPTDYDGIARPVNTTVDVGPYEYHT